MEKKEVILSVSELNIHFPGPPAFTAVNNVSFEIGRGMTLAIVGESGSGKSLTALALMGLLPKTAKSAGRLVLNTSQGNTDLGNPTGKAGWTGIRGSEVSMVFQEPMSSLNPIMKIGRQLSEAIAEHRHVSARRAREIAVEWLGKVRLPNPQLLYQRYPHQLSGGQKQRVMIAMAMCNQPVLLIADEPTTALDVTVQKEIVTLMKDLQAEHRTAMIFITHDLALAAQVADQVLVMYKGQAVEYGPAAEVLTAPKHPYAKALLACRPSIQQKGFRLPVVSDFLEGDKSESERILTGIPQEKAVVSGQPLLEVNNLRIWFTEARNWLGQPSSYFKAVDNVSFTLNKGEVLGLVGESGCGKSTLSASLMGLLPVQEGEILFNGKDLAGLSKNEWSQVRRQVQLIFQDPFASLNPRMTIGDMLMEPLKVHHIVPRNEIKKEAARLLELVHLPADSLSRYPHQFSGGQRQRLGIARALALRPQLLICDEMVSALDVSVQAQILNLLKELQHEFQLSYLFISHDLSVVHYLSDRVMVMKAGRIVETGDATRILMHPGNEYTRQLVAAVPGA